MSWSILPATQFPDHAASWQALNTEGWNTPLLHPDFFVPVYQEFSNGNEVLAIHGTAEAPDAMGIFTRANRFGWQTFQP
jgi:CelD/BcsL family acetyltransferase involved in cellulose biosynthesis